MKKYFYLLLLILCINIEIDAHSKDRISDGEVEIIRIDNQPIYLDEFKNIFYKNNHNEEVTKEYLDEYMDLFINFKLKVEEAKQLRMDTIPSFIKELNGYKDQLAQPYMVNKEFNNKILKDAYDRMNFDVNASHILISINENASEEDERKSLNQAIDIRNKILNSEISFENAALKYSQDPSAQVNKGNLGYFTAFMMVYDFEITAYNTKINDISDPVRTKYGYHLIRVNDKRPAVGKVKVAHIMYKTGKDASEEKLNETKDNIYEINKKLKDGSNFEDLAERFSQDRSTAVKGGSLPAFGVGKMVPEFEKEAFNLKNIGDISKPFRTEYGWHIIKLLEKEEIPLFEDIKDDIKRKIDKFRPHLSKEALYSQLNKDYRVVNNVNVFNSLRKFSVNKLAKGSLTKDFVKSITLSDNLFSINSKYLKKNYKTQDFIDYMLVSQGSGNNFDNLYIDFVNNSLVEYKKLILPLEHPEFKMLLNEYREGILLFDLTNKMVWNKAIEDTLGLSTFFAKNRSLYGNDIEREMVNAEIYYCIDLSTMKDVKQLIYNKNRGRNSINRNNDILNKINTDKSILKLKIDSANYYLGDNKYIDSINWSVGISNDIKDSEIENPYILININEVSLSKPIELDEVKGRVISDYQKKLDNEWISKLRSKYRVKINHDILYNLIH